MKLQTLKNFEKGNLKGFSVEFKLYCVFLLLQSFKLLLLVQVFAVP